MITVSHFGDLGDAIAQCVPVRTGLLGGPFNREDRTELCLYSAPPRAVRDPWTADKVYSVASFFELQGFDRVYHAREPAVGSVIVDGWRKVRHPSDRNLTNCALIALGLVPHNGLPWLYAPEERVAPVVIHRSPRYHSRDFPWKAVLDEFGHEAVFVGSRQECSTFRAAHGVKVPYYDTPDLLSLARVIAGCCLFVGNQSTPCNLALGLGVPCYVEEYAGAPNCRHHRDDVWYGAKGWAKVERAVW